MKKKINIDILKSNQLKVQKKQNFLQQTLYKTTYELINDLLCDVKKPFKNICIHGYYPNFMIDYLVSHRSQFSNLEKNQQKNNEKEKQEIAIIDYLNLDLFQEKIGVNQFYQNKVIKLEDSDKFPSEQERFDLIISNLQLNHTSNQEKMLEKYIRALKPDGALIGCAMVEGTLSELNWSYLMAQNQRYGGLSPKVLNFPALGQLGNMLTSTHYHLSTVLSRDFLLQFQSPLDLIKAMQIIGQSGHLKGRRKAIFKDLLISMYALYQSQFSLESSQQKEQKILSSLILSPYIGWKYSPNQPKPLKRGKNVQTLTFIDQLRKYDSELQHYRITQNKEQPEFIERQNNKKEN